MSTFSVAREFGMGLQWVGLGRLKNWRRVQVFEEHLAVLLAIRDFDNLEETFLALLAL